MSYRKYLMTDDVPPSELYKTVKIDTDSDTISRKAAIDAIEKVASLFPYKIHGKPETYDRYNEAWNDAIGRAELEINELPPAQPERIIHCKDCEWWTKQEHSPQGRCALSGMYPSGGWFCGNARMREVTE